MENVNLYMAQAKAFAVKNWMPLVGVALAGGLYLYLKKSKRKKIRR